MTDYSIVGDYSWSRPHPDQLKAIGCIGVVRYLGPGNGGRDVTPAEVRALHDGGLGLALVWETTTTAALAGWQAGYADVAAANQWADRVGFPGELPIFYAVDTDVTPAQIRGPVADTFRGAIKASSRPVRPYGEADVLDILCGELGLMPCGWQCAAWSVGKLSRFRCMYQRWPPVLDQAVDVNDLGPMPVDFLWHPTIRYDRSPLEEDMPLRDDEWDRLEAMIKAAGTRAEEATINTSGNVAGVTRDEGGKTRVAGVADGDTTRQLITELDRGDTVELNAVGNAITAAIADLQHSGGMPNGVDVDQLVATVAERLDVVPRP